MGFIFIKKHLIKDLLDRYTFISIQRLKCVSEKISFQITQCVPK